MNKNAPAYVITFMAIITIVCGAAIALVQSSMKQTLAANADLTRNRTVADAFSLKGTDAGALGYDTLLARNLTADTLQDQTGVIEYFTLTTTPATIGFIFTGMGFWDYITGILVLSPDLATIRALRIIEQKETPGLGARITEPGFFNQFSAVPLHKTGTQPFSFSKPLPETDGVIVNALTGATQTSLALERMLNRELIRFKKLYTKRHTSGTTKGER